MAKMSRVQKKTSHKHRAHKRDSVVIPPAKEGQGRDARKAAKRAAKRAAIAEAQFQAALTQENEVNAG